ncbi:MAG: hypothetical protein ACTHU0_28915 [Kofleriaceae bacterium]
MARLGELLVAAGLLTVEQVEQALRAQVMWGGRLGTNLIELGYLDLDALSKALARQHRLPAALARHFERAERALQHQLSPDVAERYAAVPLLRVGRDRDQIAIATVAPIEPRGLAIIADELAVAPAQLMPAIAAELRIKYHLERVYRIPRGTRFLRARGKTNPPFPQFEIAQLPPGSDPDLVLPTDTQELPVVAADLGALAVLDEPDAPDDELAIPAAEVTDEPSGRDRRRYVGTITDEPSTDSERQALGRIAIRRVAVTAAPGAAGATLGEATRAVRRATHRDRVADLAIDAIERFLPACDAAVLLVVRGDVAIGWKGFSRAGHPLPEIGVPLDHPGLVPRAIQRAQTARAPASELGPIDQLLLVSLGKRSGELAVVPVLIGGQVMCLIALVGELEAPLSGADTIAAAAGAAFARLMRDASR